MPAEVRGGGMSKFKCRKNDKTQMTKGSKRNSFPFRALYLGTWNLESMLSRRSMIKGNTWIVNRRPSDIGHSCLVIRHSFGI